MVTNVAQQEHSNIKYYASTFSNIIDLLCLNKVKGI